jgi:hypothetical protein
MQDTGGPAGARRTPHSVASTAAATAVIVVCVAGVGGWGGGGECHKSIKCKMVFVSIAVIACTVVMHARSGGKRCRRRGVAIPRAHGQRAGAIA